MIAAMEAFCRQEGYCKITLEVLGNNVVAKKAYMTAGFEGYELTPEAGKAEFWQKKIND